MNSWWEGGCILLEEEEESWQEASFVLYWQGGRVCLSEGTRKWSKVEKASKRERATRCIRRDEREDRGEVSGYKRGTLGVSRT